MNNSIKPSQADIPAMLARLDQGEPAQSQFEQDFLGFYRDLTEMGEENHDAIEAACEMAEFAQEVAA